jgi:ribonuclease HI
MEDHQKRILIYTDGGARGNPGPAAIGVLIYTYHGRLLESHREYIGKATNNVAEYTAVITALRQAGKFSDHDIYCHSDSQLIVNQLSGTYAVKEPHLQELLRKVRELEKQFKKVTYTYLPRTDPRIGLADSLVNRVLNDDGLHHRPEDMD